VQTKKRTQWTHSRFNGTIVLYDGSLRDDLLTALRVAHRVIGDTREERNLSGGGVVGRRAEVARVHAKVGETALGGDLGAASRAWLSAGFETHCSNVLADETHRGGRALRERAGSRRLDRGVSRGVRGLSAPRVSREIRKRTRFRLPKSAPRPLAPKTHPTSISRSFHDVTRWRVGETARSGDRGGVRFGGKWTRSRFRETEARTFFFGFRALVKK
jgi:hypothetical protein